MARDNDIQIVASLDIPKSKSSIDKDISILEKDLQNDANSRPKLLATLDVNKSKKAIQASIDKLNLQKNVPKIKVGLDIDKSNVSKINSDLSQKINKGQQPLQLFNSADLEADGRKYFTKTTNIIDRVKKYYLQNGALKVDISSLETTKGQIQKFTAQVEESTGVIKSFNYERSLIDTGGKKPNYGYVVSDIFKSVDKNAGANLKSTLDYFTKIDKQIMSIESKTTKQSNPLKEGTTYFDNYNNKLIETKSKIDDIRNANEILSTEHKNEIDKMITSLSLYAKEQQKLAYPPMISSKSIGDSVAEASAHLTTLEQKWQRQGILTGEFQNRIEQLKVTLGNVDSTEGLKKYATDLKLANEEAIRLKASLGDNTSFRKFTQDIQNLESRIVAFRNVNSKSEQQFGGVYDNLLNKIQEIKAQTANGIIDKNALDEVSRGFRNATNNVKAFGLTGQNVFQTLWAQTKKFSSWMTLTFLISGVARNIRNMTNEVIELDSAMTNLKKVTDETEATYNKFLDGAAVRAKKMHSTISDLVEQTATWVKLGYDLSKAEKLAETSMIYSKVGEVSNDTAVSDIVTIMKAFNIEAENSIKIVDIMNILGNKFATSASALGEGMSKSASALRNGNNSLEQSLALLTGGTEITQNSAEMANALKVITMRIQGMKGNLEELGEEYENVESISKTQTHILNLTGGKVNIFDDQKNFRSTYEILKEISEIIDTLEDTKRADLIETLFGKMRGNQGMAILQAFQSGQIEKAYQTALKSAGSAQKEFDTWSDSIEAHINDFKTSYESLSKTIINSNFLKGLIDLGTNLLNILEKLIDKGNILSTLAGLTAGGFSFKNKGIFQIVDEESGQKLTTFLQARKQAQEEATRQLSIDQECLEKYAAACNDSNVTSAQLSSTLQNASVEAKLYAKNIKNGTGTVQGFTNAHGELAKSVSVATIGLKALQVVGNMLIVTLATKIVTSVISGIAKLADKIITTTEELQEKSTQAYNKYEQINNEISLLNDKVATNNKLIEESKEYAEYDGYRQRLAAENEELKNQIQLQQINAKEERDKADKNAYKFLTKESYKYNPRQIEWNYRNNPFLGHGTVYQTLYDKGDITDVTDYLLDQAESTGKVDDELSKHINTIEEYYGKLDESKPKSKALSDEINTLIKRYIALYPEIQQAENSTNDLNASLQNEVTSINEIKKGFADYFDDSFSPALDNISKIEEALQKLAEGEMLDFNEMWEISDLDTEGIISSIKEVNGQYVIGTDEIIAVKDALIEKQKEQIIANINEAQTAIDLAKERLKAEEAILYTKRLSVNSPSDIKYLEDQKRIIQSITDEISGYERVIDRNNLLIKQLNWRLKDTVDYSKVIENNVSKLNEEISQLQTQADNLLKAQEEKIGGIIDKLEDEKSVMQNQLDVLEQQREELETIIENHEKAADIVGETIEKEISSIEDQRSQIEDYYNNLIDNLRESNEERENALSMAEKLAALEKAQTNKKRVYREETGWDNYEVDKEALIKAENELLNAQNEAEIKKLEKEKEQALQGFETQITELKEYAELWENVVNDITKAENELTATEILGSDWREKIKNKDTSIITKFKDNFNSYNTNLKMLINNEIANLKNSITAKEKEINSWRDYQSQIQKSAKAIESAYSEYVDVLGSITLDEKSNWNTRQENLEKFTSAYKNYISQISDKNEELKVTTSNLEALNGAMSGMNASSFPSALSGAAFDLRTAVNEMNELSEKLKKNPIKFGMINSEGDAKRYALLQELSELLGTDLGIYTGYSYSSGGVNDKTGYAMMHGTKTASEVVFNANDAKKLYQLVHNTPNLVDLIQKDALNNMNRSNINNTTNRTIINQNQWQFGNIIANDPLTFAQKINAYFGEKITESKVL